MNTEIDALANARRKICVVVASRANYGRIKSLMRAIDNSDALELQLIVSASTLLERFGRAVKIIEADGFKPQRTLHHIVEGETLLTQAKSTGLGIIELATALEDLGPDAVVTVADRYETLSTAVAAAYMNIPLIHVQGGEVSGNIDDRVRHAITKFSDYHFPCTEQSKQRLLRMGEHPDTVFNFGCPAMDVLCGADLSISNEQMRAYTGVGDNIDWSKPYILVVQHPVTTSFGRSRQEIEQTLTAMASIAEVQKVVLWPNIDAGSDDVSKAIRVMREQGRAVNFRFFKNFSPEDYARVIANASCCVGNSSSFIREGSFLGVPAVVVGDRQRDREHGENIVFAAYQADDIYRKTLSQLEIGRYPCSDLFGAGNAGDKIAAKLGEIDLGRIKRNVY